MGIWLMAPGNLLCGDFRALLRNSLFFAKAGVDTGKNVCYNDGESGKPLMGCSM